MYSIAENLFVNYKMPWILNVFELIHEIKLVVSKDNVSKWNRIMYI